ncbi:hypothetical protein K449DRAFT_383980 [Hypoxylon sp. EC38]|nr:hypothetical protein K449DRAFT_383980 [Hypoxylon sp. EC38]
MSLITSSSLVASTELTTALLLLTPLACILPLGGHIVPHLGRIEDLGTSPGAIDAPIYGMSSYLQMDL